MNTMSVNGRQRKSLAEQIDRLDRMLDGLADGLNEAIASAVQQAVKQVLAEVLTSAELQARLQPTVESVEATVELPASKAPAVESTTARVASVCRRIGSWVKDRLLAGVRVVKATAIVIAETCGRLWQDVAESCARAKQRFCSQLAMVWFVLYSIRHLAGAVLTASVAAAAAGMAAYHLSPLVAAVTSGTGGFVATLAVHVALWARQTFLHWATPNR